jgi:CDP-diacylglycerol--serine O-phosphatidyltransferase
VRYRRQASKTGLDLPERRRRRGVAVLPALFTLGNCICGFASLGYASNGPVATGTVKVGPIDLSNYSVAAYLIFAAMVFDMFDGFVARLTHATSDFGAELDSLADMVSFGVAPAFLALQLIYAMLHDQYPGAEHHYEWLGPNADSQMGRLFWIIGAVYVGCTALRLARFNVRNKHEVDSHMSFRGMPSPGAAGVVASSIIFFEGLYADRHFIRYTVPTTLKEQLKHVFPYLMPIVLLIAALLMVSRFPYAHLINRFLRGRKKFRQLVGMFLVVMLLVFQPQIIALLAIYIYAVSAPLSLLLVKMFRRRPNLPNNPTSTPSPTPTPTK